MDDHDSLVEVQRHGLQLDAATIKADQDQTRVRDLCRGHSLWLDSGYHVHRMGLADAMAPRGAVPPDVSVHVLSVTQNTSEAGDGVALSCPTFQQAHHRQRPRATPDHPLRGYERTFLANALLLAPGRMRSAEGGQCDEYGYRSAART